MVLNKLQYNKAAQIYLIIYSQIMGHMTCDSILEKLRFSWFISYSCRHSLTFNAIVTQLVSPAIKLTGHQAGLFKKGILFMMILPM